MVLLIYFLILMSSVLLGIINLKKIKHTSIILFWMYVLFTLVFEISGFFFQKYYSPKSNIIIFNLSIPFIFLSILLFYYNNFKKKILKKIYLVIIFIFIGIYTIDLISKNIYLFKSSIYLVMCWFFAISAILYFLLMILYPTEEEIIKNSSFYFSGAILLLNTFLIIYMSLYAQLITSLKKINLDVSILKTTISYISYLIIFYGFLCLHKKTILD